MTETTNDITPEEYIIGPEDVLEVSVWQNQDVSRVVSVRPAPGKISLPPLHDIQAAGLTATELKEVIVLYDFRVGREIRVRITLLLTPLDYEDEIGGSGS